MRNLPNAAPFAKTAAKYASLLLVAAATGPIAADYTVQIGAFGTSPSKAFTRDAANFGEVLINDSGDGVTRVSIGSYATRSDARDVLTRLQIAGYNDAYITNLTAGQSASSPSSQIAAPVQTTSTAPSTRSQSQPTASTAGATDSAPSQAGRFRLRTHDTQSGQTTDVQLTPAGATAPAAVVAGVGANEVPPHLRDKLVYLDGVPHIKEGDKFIPLNDAVGRKP